MSFHDATHRSQAHAGTGAVRTRVQTSKRFEDRFCIHYIDTNPFVLNDEQPIVDGQRLVSGELLEYSKLLLQCVD